jgi:putative ABC transport system ATP-binding protein
MGESETASNAEGSPRLELGRFRCLHVGPIDLQLQANECISLGGPSGTGKSLLLRAIADLDPHDGDLRLDGRDYLELSGPQWREQVGLLPPETAWWARRVGDHFPPDDTPPLAAVGLPEEALSWEVTRLSSGERQRLGLLRLLAHRPAVLLLDEPTANLDAKGVKRVEALIDDYRSGSGAAVLWVSHDAEQRRRVADRELRLANGRLEPADELEEES